MESSGLNFQVSELEFEKSYVKALNRRFKPLVCHYFIVLKAICLTASWELDVFIQWILPTSGIWKQKYKWKHHHPIIAICLTFVAAFRRMDILLSFSYHPVQFYNPNSQHTFSLFPTEAFSFSLPNTSWCFPVNPGCFCPMNERDHNPFYLCSEWKHSRKNSSGNVYAYVQVF